MKIGKYIPLGEYNNVKIGYGTVDFKNLKTIYIKLNSWVQPNNCDEDFNNSILKSRRKIKQIIQQLDLKEFKTESIVDLDIRTNGIKINKKSFMNLEITLFVNDFFDVKSKNTKKLIKSMIISIIDDGLTNNNLYNFSLTKK